MSGHALAIHAMFAQFPRHGMIPKRSVGDVGPRHRLTWLQYLPYLRGPNGAAASNRWSSHHRPASPCGSQPREVAEPSRCNRPRS